MLKINRINIIILLIVITISCNEKIENKKIENIQIDSINIRHFDTIICGLKQYKEQIPNISYAWEKPSYEHRFPRGKYTLYYYESFDLDTVRHINSILIKNQGETHTQLELFRYNFCVCNEVRFDKDTITTVHPVTGETLCLSNNFFGTKEIENYKIDELLKTIEKHKSEFKESKYIVQNYYCKLNIMEKDSIQIYSSTKPITREIFEPIKEIRSLLNY